MFSGVGIDTPRGTGFCADHATTAAMVTAGEYQISKIVAVWRSGSGELHVLPRCGRSREFPRQIDPANLDVEVIHPIPAVGIETCDVRVRRVSGADQSRPSTVRSAASICHC
jgi:hypothetical protein